MVIRMDTLPPDMSSATLIQFVEAITRDPDGVQQKVLGAILDQSQGCHYLTKHGLSGSCTWGAGGDFKCKRAMFKARLPVVEYEDIKEDIQRVVDGDKSPVLCVPPVAEFFTR